MAAPFVAGDRVTVVVSPSRPEPVPARVTAVDSYQGDTGLCWVINFQADSGIGPNGATVYEDATGEPLPANPVLTFVERPGPCADVQACISADEGNLLRVGSDGGLYVALPGGDG